MLNVIFNGVYADDIRREIEVGEDISLMRILCKIQIAHGDVRTAGAQHRFPVRESDRADLVFVKHQRLCRLVGLVGQCHKEFVRISEEHLVVSADSDSTVFQPALEMFDRVASEGFVEIGLFKFGRAAGHVKHRFPSVPFKVGALVLSDLRTVRRHMDMIAQKCGITQHPLEKIKGILKKFADFFARQSDGIDELIVGMCHPSVHQRGIVICLDNTEGRSILALVKCIEPTFEALLNGHTFRHELQILEAALGNDQLDLLDLPRRGLAGELADLRDAVIRKPLLQICVEGAGLEEAVSEQHDFLGIYMLFLNEILNLCRHRCGLACTCTGNQKAIIIIGHNGSSLLIVKTNLRIDFSKNVIEIVLFVNKCSFDIFLIMGNNALIQRMHLSQKAF